MWFVYNKLHKTIMTETFAVINGRSFYHSSKKNLLLPVKTDLVKYF